MNKTLETIKNMPGSKAAVAEYTRTLKEEILSGNMDPLEAEVKLRAMEDIIKGLRQDPEVKEYSLQELDKYDTKTIEKYGAVISQVNRTKYDYTQDETWKSYKDTEGSAADFRKAREKQLQSMKDGGVDTVTGEEFNALPRESTRSISIKLL